MSGEIEHLHIQANGIELHLACQGEGPLVVLCHGFPGLWYSWRHQLPALAEAGYRAVAIDCRGYGSSSRPHGCDNYTYDKTSADILAVLDHCGEEQAVLFGHDFGANLAWHMAVHHRDRIKAVASLCVPYGMELAGNSGVPPSELYAATAQHHFFHMHYYQMPGVGEAGCVGREREFLSKLFWALCADGELLNWENFPSQGTAYVDVLAQPPMQPPWPWLSEEDFDYYLSQYLCSDPQLTFAGGINAYRAMDGNWQLFDGANLKDVEIPAIYIGGKEDPTVTMGGQEQFVTMQKHVKDLRGMELLPGAGHFLQQEQPAALNKALLEFLHSL